MRPGRRVPSRPTGSAQGRGCQPRAAFLHLTAAALRAGLPGVRRHRAALRRRGAAGGMLLLLLPLLRALRGTRVPETEPADAQPTPGAVRRCAAAVGAPAVSAAAAGKASPGSCHSLQERLRRGGTKERKRRRWGRGPVGQSPSRQPRSGAPRASASPRREGRGWARGASPRTSHRVPHCGAQRRVPHLRWESPGENVGSVLLPLTPTAFFLQGRRCVRLRQQQPLLAVREQHLPQRQQHRARPPLLPALHPPGTSATRAGHEGRAAPALGVGRGPRGVPTPHRCPISAPAASRLRHRQQQRPVGQHQ